MTDQLEKDNLALEIICKFCRGRGGPEDGDPLLRCTRCDGRGFVPTEIGERVLALVQHNFKPMLREAVRR